MLKNEDIKILTEGQLLEKAILRKYKGMTKEEAIMAFANASDRNYSSIHRYTRSRIVNSQNMKIRANALLGDDEIFVSEEKQLQSYIDDIYINIQEYINNQEIQVIEKLIDMCVVKSYKIQLAKLYWIKGKYYNNTIGIDYFKLAISIYDENRDIISRNQVRSDLALAYLMMHEYGKAKEILENQICDIENFNKLTANSQFLIYYRLGICKLDIDEINEARQLFEKAYNIANNNIYKGNAVKNIGLACKKQKQYDKALDYYYQALSLFKEDDKYVSVMLNNIAMVCYEKGYLNDALRKINEAISIVNNKGDIDLQYNYIHTYTLIMIKKGEPKEALELLLKLTEKTDCIVYKKNMMMGIETMLEYGLQNKQDYIVKRIEKMLLSLINNNIKNNEFVMHCKACLGDIYINNLECEEVSV